MATTTKAVYGTQNQSITCTITSLTTGSSRQSTAIDNTTNLYLDSLVSIIVKSGASSTATTGTVVVYAAGTSDGTNYTDNADGPDGSFTPTSPTNLKIIGIVNVVANATTYYGGPFSVAAAFGGILPEKYTIVVTNSTGGTLDASVGSLNYQGVQLQNV